MSFKFLNVREGLLTYHNRFLKVSKMSIRVPADLAQEALGIHLSANGCSTLDPVETILVLGLITP